ncbi:repulsive guidance molecule B isoform X2 [Leopardus geoffroyi]|uniref:repulsive guidance molecule B isoform X2 n=1 Tax=Leopardus geoffroyi TaxID=46844 RepID=UPI001E262155|nr:repulsive guidance molecule B isoform X2 [Leopardus geoffroyi]
MEKKGCIFVAAGAQLPKILERRARDRIRACAAAQSGNSLHVSAAARPRDGWHDRQLGIGWCRGWRRDRAGWKGAAPLRALTPQSRRRESGPRGGASLLPPGIAAPTWGGEAGAALPSLCAPAAWLAAYFPSWQASRCRQGNACGDCQQPAQCRIQKCTTDFVSLTSHLNSAIDGFDSEFCKALRAYAGCTQRTSKACRGNLVYHSAVLGISDLMSQRNCSKDGPTSSTNPEVTHDPCNYHSHAGAREHRGGDLNPPSYLFCGLFGDPHLRTFKDHFQTCKVEGAWPLIDNNYLSVQVTNVPVVPGSSATATNKITIIFKAHRECTDQKVYQAVTDDLPAAFVDGSTSGGDGDTKSLLIVERESGRYVEMHARYIGTTVFVRQLGRYLTLAIRMPEDLAMSYEESQDLQLCVNGCPLSERIDDGQGQVSAILGHSVPRTSLAQAWPGYTLEAANAQCHEKMPVKDIYFQSCVFDLLTTGDANFTAAAHSALEDVEALHPRKERWHIFPSSSHGTPRGGGHLSVSLGLTCLIFIVFL